jgi:arylsulfatase A-like enzyme
MQVSLCNNGVLLELANRRLEKVITYLNTNFLSIWKVKVLSQNQTRGMAFTRFNALRFLEWVVAIIYFVVTCGCSGEIPSSSRKMNLLLITLDTLRADHLNCYGYEKNTSPALEALASTSVVFDNAIAQSAVTPVSHASILTGLNPYNHKLRSLHGGVGYKLPDNCFTLAELLKSHGYATGGFVSAFPVTMHYGLHQGFETWDEEFAKDGDTRILTDSGIVNTGRTQRRGDETTTKAVTWLRQHTNTPFFAWIHYFDVHDPLVLPPKKYLALFPPTSRRKADVLRSIYDSEISFVDEQINRVLGELDRLNVRDNTVVVVLSDHGEGLGDHQWWGHSILYQEQIRIVFILSIPGQGEGRRVSSLVRSIDLVPTIIELFNLDVPSESLFDGKSLIELINGAVSHTRIAYSESINDLTAYQGSPLQKESLYAISDGRWKFILHWEDSKDKQHELFDLHADPHELRNLSDIQPEVTLRLRNRLKGMQTILADPPHPVIDAKTLERLRSLGYAK